MIIVQYTDCIYARNFTFLPLPTLSQQSDMFRNAHIMMQADLNKHHKSVSPHYDKLSTSFKGRNKDKEGQNVSLYLYPSGKQKQQLNPNTKC